MPNASKLTIEFDVDDFRARASELPAEVEDLAALDEGLRNFYIENDEGKHVLDETLRDRFIEQVAGALEMHNVKRENLNLKQTRDRERVATSVRESLAKVVKPNMLDAAVALFLSRHRCAIDDEGNVVVTGKRGAASAEAACVQFLDDEEAARAFTQLNETPNGEFTDALRKMMN